MLKNDCILVTGGLGYIGSHFVAELVQKNIDVVIVDDLSNSYESTFGCIENIKSDSKLTLELCDIRNTKKLIKIFEHYCPKAVVHFAGLKSVPESVKNPIKYFDYNLGMCTSLLSAMASTNCSKIIFSSTAAVYDESDTFVLEDFMLKPKNAYASSKMMIEHLLNYWSQNSLNRKVICLRYFNPIGAHNKFSLGENSLQTLNNLMPAICKAARIKTNTIDIFGKDYHTRDGTGERDFIHIMDLANAHLAAFENINRLSGFSVYNVGTGEGTTVLELIRSFELFTGEKIQYKFQGRRLGDIARSVANVDKINSDLNWSAQYSIKEMCEDAWKWELKRVSLK